MKDITDAYAYRSTVAHGGFVLDLPDDWPEYQKRTPKRPQDPFRDHREILRLTDRISDLYRRAVQAILRAELNIDWSSLGL